MLYVLVLVSAPVAWIAFQPQTLLAESLARNWLLLMVVALAPATLTGGWRMLMSSVGVLTVLLGGWAWFVYGYMEYDSQGDAPIAMLLLSIVGWLAWGEAVAYVVRRFTGCELRTHFSGSKYKGELE